MLTAVQEQQGKGLNCAVINGYFESIRASSKGPVKLFKKGQIVFYRVAIRNQPKRIQGFLFRTGEGRSNIPGVYPNVNILAYAEKQGQVTRLRKAIAWLHQNGYELNQLNDHFFAKINSLLAARDFQILHLKQVINETVI